MDAADTQTHRWLQHWMLLFVPLALVLEHVQSVSAPIIFAVAALAIVPIGRLISNSTEHLAHYTGDSIGALLNSLLGNLPELIIAIVALQAGLHAMVAASIVGAILFNLLLVLGSSFLLGGLRRHTFAFNAQAVRVYSTMMFIAVMSLALPSIYEHAFAVDTDAANVQTINVGVALLLLVLYGLYLLYMIRTHPEEFVSVGGHVGDEAESHWRLPICIGVLIGSSLLAAVVSEILVGAVQGTGEALGLSNAFLGIVLLAGVGGVAEAMSAVAMARKGRFDLSVGIALGSCILIALFVAPVLVLISYFVGPRPFRLSFNAGGIGLLFLVVLIGMFVASGDSGNWYKGVQLIAVYLMIGLLLYFLPS